jgi:amino acid transporter
MATETGVGEGAAGQLFVRRTSGLTRTVSPWGALAFAFVVPGMNYAFLYMTQMQTVYPTALAWVSSLFIFAMFPFAGIYMFMSLSMPRSGGEYIYVSRILHPLLGFVASWAIIITGINWSGLLSQWTVNWGLGNLFLAEGLAHHNATLVRWGKYLSVTTPDNRPVIWLLSSAVLATAFFVISRGTKTVMKFMWVVMAVTWLMLITFIIVALSRGGAAHTIAGFEKVQGISWTEVTSAVNSISGGAGLPAFAVLGTVWAGLAWVNLNTLGTTYAANMSGEIKRVNRAMPLAQFGSLSLFVLYWFIFARVADHGLGQDNIRALAYIDQEGTATSMLNTVPLVSYQVVWMTQNWFLVAVAGPLSFLIATWFGGVMGLSFAPIRNLFAFSFDGLLPGWMNKVSRNGSPNNAVIVAFLIAWGVLTVAVFTTWYNYITYTVTIWMVGWVIVGIAATVFPWARKDIFEKSPAIVQSRVLGIPWITILGILGTIVAAVTVYGTFLVGTTPSLNTKNLGFSALFFVLLPIIIYFIATAYQRSKGVPMDKRFKTVPPD